MVRAGQRRALLTRVGVVLVCCYFVPVALLTVFQDRFVYLPDPVVPPIESTLPGGEEVTYTASDGTVERGWLIHPTGKATGITAVVFHGAEGNRSTMAAFARQLADAGVSALLVEYRGYGGVAGTPSLVA